MATGQGGERKTAYVFSSEKVRDELPDLNQVTVEEMKNSSRSLRSLCHSTWQSSAS